MAELKTGSERCTAMTRAVHNIKRRLYVSKTAQISRCRLRLHGADGIELLQFGHTCELKHVRTGHKEDYGWHSLPYRPARAVLYEAWPL